MLGQSFGDSSFQLAILATPCSKCCWKKLRSSALIIVAGSQSHVRLRPSNSF
ncbi:hypothetical protein I3843_03G191600 [Carya illinoinensis]|nr:hypothetical protein I3843_03G191600 [Carya illinoinensis]